MRMTTGYTTSCTLVILL